MGVFFFRGSCITQVFRKNMLLVYSSLEVVKMSKLSMGRYKETPKWTNNSTWSHPKRSAVLYLCALFHGFTHRMVRYVCFVFSPSTWKDIWVVKLTLKISFWIFCSHDFTCGMIQTLRIYIDFHRFDSPPTRIWFPTSSPQTLGITNPFGCNQWQWSQTFEKTVPGKKYSCKSPICNKKLAQCLEQLTFQVFLLIQIPSTRWFKVTILFPI